MQTVYYCRSQDVSWLLIYVSVFCPVELCVQEIEADILHRDILRLNFFYIYHPSSTTYSGSVVGAAA